MTTQRFRGLGSLAAALMMTVAVGACARNPSPEARPAATAAAQTIRFANDAQEHVHVYLVGEQRQWLLGRVDPGAIATLRVPRASFDADFRTLRLAVVAGEHSTAVAMRDPRATFTMPQSAAAMVSQQWRFAQGHLSSRWLAHAGMRMQ